MKFTLATKPFVDALGLGIINSNVSKYYQKSCIAQLTASNNKLRVNLEASSLCTSLTFRGSQEGEGEAKIFVDSLLLKQLVNTFEANTTTLEFTENGLILHSGKSKFTLPKMLDIAEMELKQPAEITGLDKGEAVNIDSWKFIKDYQMYAIAMSFVYPQYTRILLGEDGLALVGDFDRGLFTKSFNGDLDSNALISDTIINLFTCLPEGAQIYKHENSYIISVNTDGFEMRSQFTPESQEMVESYNSSIICDTFHEDADNCTVVELEKIKKCLSQADLLSSGSDDVINLGVADGSLVLKDENVFCSIPVETNSSTFNCDFKTGLLKSVMSNMDDEKVRIAPLFGEDDSIMGITVWTDKLSAVLSGVE